MIEYVPIGIQILLALALTLTLMGLSAWLGRPGRSRTDLSPYESGADLLDASDKRFTVRYYMVAMLFILFDIEAAFLYPWTTVFRAMGSEGFISMLVFLLILSIGFIYCWRKGALDWD